MNRTSIALSAALILLGSLQAHAKEEQDTDYSHYAEITLRAIKRTADCFVYDHVFLNGHFRNAFVEMFNLLFRRMNHQNGGNHVNNV